MSSGGGYYKYRCKNFYSNNCPNWVWVNNTACAECTLNGLDSLSLSRRRRDSAELDIDGGFETNTSRLSLNCGAHDHKDEEVNDEAPVRPSRDPCNRFHSGYL
ncbi:hypothetical protein TWF694_006784 [Orbilia ellipsospora]|uniref:Uncharacterized protein n=1 Tax=Orbilia ellipsospora TaxID=2528407 RepID=A0AAV9XL89_9PEZI